jgi:hypothetical protein
MHGKKLVLHVDSYQEGKKWERQSSYTLHQDNGKGLSRMFKETLYHYYTANYNSRISENVHNHDTPKPGILSHLQTGSHPSLILARKKGSSRMF